MYHHNVKLSFKSFVSALLAIPLLAVAVNAQTMSSVYRKQSAISRADLATINAQDLPVIGATAANRQRPTVRDEIFAEQPPPPERENPGRRIGKAEAPAQQEVNPDGDNLATIPHWSDSFTHQRLTYKYTTTTIPTVDMPIEDGMDATEAGRQNALAGTIAVTSTADDGPGSLRQALALASDGDTINIVARGTITLTSGELVVDKSLTSRARGKEKQS